MAEALPGGTGAQVPGPATWTDEQALAAFLRGDETMASELVRRYEGPLYAFLCRLTGRPADAADLFQETFLRVVERADSFAGRSRFKTWLYGIALNAWRSGGRRRREATIPGDAPPPVNGAPGPNGLAEREEIGVRIAEAVAQLPEPQREVFIMKVYDHMNYGEIAEALGEPLGTVKSRMRMALGKVRVVLRDLAEAYGLA